MVGTTAAGLPGAPTTVVAILSGSPTSAGNPVVVSSAFCGGVIMLCRSHPFLPAEAAAGPRAEGQAGSRRLGFGTGCVPPNPRPQNVLSRPGRGRLAGHGFDESDSRG